MEKGFALRHGALRIRPDPIFSYRHPRTYHLHWKASESVRVISHRVATRDTAAISAAPTEFRLANSHVDLFSAFHLLQRRYRDSGLSQSEQPIRVEEFHLWQESQVFIASRHGRVVGCATLIRPGNAFGLPFAQSHPEVYESVPSPNRIAELTSLAVDPDATRNSSSVFTGLMQLAQLYALQLGIDHATAIVNPRHARAYCRSIGFRIVGDQRPCDRVEGQPGVALLGKIDRATVCHPRWRDRFIPDRAGDVDLNPRPMTASQRRFFESFVVGGTAKRVGTVARNAANKAA